MDVEIPNADLRRIAIEPSSSVGLPEDASVTYRKALQILMAIETGAALDNFRFLRLRKMRRRNRHSIALNDDFDLIIEFPDGGSGTRVVVERIRKGSAR